MNWKKRSKDLLFHQDQIETEILLNFNEKFPLICLEKEAVRQLITTAIRGLEENGRIPSAFNADENAKGVQVNMDPLGSLLAAKSFSFFFFIKRKILSNRFDF